MTLHSQSLALTVLVGPTVTRVQVKRCILIQAGRRQDLIVKILLVPPETAAHTNCLLVLSGPSVESIAANQCSQTAPTYSIRPCCSIDKPLPFDDRFELFLQEIKVLISFSSKLVPFIIRVCILIVPIIGIPYPHHDHLPHTPFSHQLCHSILYFPSCSKGGLTVIKQILTVVEQKHLVLFKSVVMVGRRVVERTLARVTQD